MSVQIGHLSLVPARGPAAAPSPSRSFPAALAAAEPSVTADVIPASPPDEVLDEVGVAGRVANELHDANRELHFAKDEGSGRIVVQVRDLDGNVLRTIPPSEALDIMSGLGEP